VTEAECIIASDDESYTYNARVNRLNPIAEHKMITKAVQNGVRPQRIAAALNLTAADVKSSMSLLDGINEEAADLLKDKAISPKAIRLMRKVTGVRQIEIAELMVSANNYTSGYAEALVLGTPKDQLLHPEEQKQKKGLTREEIGKMEAELGTLERDLKAVEGAYGKNNLNLTLAKCYVKRLLENAKVVRFLNGSYREILAEFESLAAAEGV
jgi:CRISPR/Cas system-associated protein Csx1